MSSPKTDKESENQARNETESVIHGVSDVVTAFFDVGASLARTVAEATASNKPVPAPSPNAAPLNAIVHYSVITVGNVLNVFAAGLKSKPSATAAPASSNTRNGSPAQTTSDLNAVPRAETSLPVVQRGATLRIPLSIENPGKEPMQHMRFLCLEMQGGTPGIGLPLTISAVRFEPETLTVEARDFEKLTVFIDTGFDTSPGRYKALLGLGGGTFELSVEFEVLAQAV